MEHCTDLHPLNSLKIAVFWQAHALRMIRPPMGSRTYSIDRFVERFMVAIGALVLIGAAAVLDDRVRDRATGVFAGTAMTELTTARDLAARSFQQAANTVGYQS